MTEIIIGLAMTFVLYGMHLAICDMRDERRQKDRLRRMRDRYYELYEGARTECDRKYFYSVYVQCAEKLREEYKCR